MPRFEWYCHRHGTPEPTRYACVEDVLRAKDEEITRLRDQKEAETLRANIYLDKIKELKAAALTQGNASWSQVYRSSREAS